MIPLNKNLENMFNTYTCLERVLDKHITHESFVVAFNVLLVRNISRGVEIINLFIFLKTTNDILQEVNKKDTVVFFKSNFKIKEYFLFEKI